MKRALLDLSKLELSVKKEPLICIDEEDENDDDNEVWTKYTPTPGPPDPVSSSLSSTSSSSLSVNVRDEFLPIPLDEIDQNNPNVDVDQVIHMLEDNFANIVKNPRIHSLSRIPCFCHLLQVNVLC